MLLEVDNLPTSSSGRYGISKDDMVFTHETLKEFVSSDFNIAEVMSFPSGEPKLKRDIDRWRGRFYSCLKKDGYVDQVGVSSRCGKLYLYKK